MSFSGLEGYLGSNRLSGDFDCVFTKSPSMSEVSKSKEAQPKEKSTWKYALVKSVEFHGGVEEVSYAIHEIYLEGNRVAYWSAKPTPVVAEDMDGVLWVMDKCREACASPVVDADLLEAGRLFEETFLKVD